LLLAELRSALDKYAKEHAPGYRFLVTVGSPAGPENYKRLHLKEMDEYLDAWHIMAYDYAGPWDNLTGHNANLFPSKSIPDATPFSTEKAIMDYIEAGVPAKKIVMGIPLYGRSFQGTTGPGKPFSGVGSPDFESGSFEAGLWAYKVLPKVGATEVFDSESKASYSYDLATKEFISYDNVEEAELKATYIKERRLGGAMYWESSGDKNGSESLIQTVAGSFENLDESENQLEYPASQYDNIKAGMPGE
jgi:chitinase